MRVSLITRAVRVAAVKHKQTRRRQRRSIMTVQSFVHRFGFLRTFFAEGPSCNVRVLASPDWL
jgi:hypothetical protein